MCLHLNNWTAFRYRRNLVSVTGEGDKGDFLAKYECNQVSNQFFYMYSMNVEDKGSSDVHSCEHLHKFPGLRRHVLQNRKC